ncbi:T-cell differentiation antigen CD6-like isoform X1 [Paramuricea clavata]|uniref:T-cell differentiation antigen CD6-like isoform X1 n=1 Tax=Paramuricea clavata TaxID=317549 RepID=A0A7D9DYF3_PARCT|nr:T-cell differentiation antigen CD6-like isoform X1 [Paramuricea clavata]
MDLKASNRTNLLPNGSLEIKQFTAVDNGDYWCYAINPTGDRVSGSHYVGLIPTPSGTIPAPSEINICSAFYTTLGVELSYFTTLDGWFKDDVQIDFATTGLRMRGRDSALEFPSAQKSDAGVYHFSASNKRGSTISNKIVVHIISSADTSGNHPVRLAGGPGDNAGRVEIYSGGKWGAVGDEGWDIDDGNVVCKELGFQHALEISRHLPADYPQFVCKELGFQHALEISRHLPADYPQVFLNNVQCTGSEAKLSDCTASYDTLYASNLTTAGVVCQNLRLVSGGKK